MHKLKQMHLPSDDYEYVIQPGSWWHIAVKFTTCIWTRILLLFQTHIPCTVCNGCFHVKSKNSIYCEIHVFSCLINQFSPDKFDDLWPLDNLRLTVCSRLIPLASLMTSTLDTPPHPVKMSRTERKMKQLKNIIMW